MNLSVTHAWRKSNFKTVLELTTLKMLINYVKMYYQILHITTGVDFGEGQRPLKSDTQRGEICLTPIVFWQVMPTWYSKCKV